MEMTDFSWKIDYRMLLMKIRVEADAGSTTRVKMG